MCFSAQASFLVAGLLALLSFKTIQKARNRTERFLAATPLFFAAQQASEGIVWITLTQGDMTSIIHKLGVYGFLFFAFLWWPVWIPLVLQGLESAGVRKKIIQLLAVPGILFALSLTDYLFWYGSAAEIVQNHILYTIPISNPVSIIGLIIAYLMATIIPLFLSRVSGLWILGIVISMGLILSYLFYSIFFVSVWCFFAAISSILITIIIMKKDSEK